MWFLGTLPTEWQQTFTIQSIEMARQKTTIEVTCDEASKVAIPYPYTYGKNQGSLDIVSHSGLSNIQVYETIKHLSRSIDYQYSVILNDAKTSYAHDDIGWILADVESSFSISYKHKLHYSSYLWIPTQISPLHYNKPCKINTSINVHDGILSSYPDFWNVSWKGDVICISITHDDIYKAYGIEDMKISTANWESSDDELDTNTLTDLDEFDSKEFLKKVGIYN